MKIFACSTCLLGESVFSSFHDALMFKKASGNYWRQRQRVKLYRKVPGVTERKVVYKFITSIKRVHGRFRGENMTEGRSTKEVVYPGHYFEEVKNILQRRRSIKFDTIKDFQRHLR